MFENSIFGVPLFPRFKALLCGSVLSLQHWWSVLGGAGANSERLSQTEGQKVCQQNHLSWVKGTAQSWV